MCSSVDVQSYLKNKEKCCYFALQNDLEEYAKVEQLPKLDGKKMFLYLTPKKAGVVKKSQQKMDRERREAEANAAAKEQKEKRNRCKWRVIR